MPEINADGCMIHAEVTGPEGAPVLMLSNSLGTNLHMWDDQVAPFTRHFRLLRYDRRGHGQSGVPKGPYSMERLGRDVLAILDGLGIDKVNWCGLSMGGMVGQWLGANAPNRIDKLILSNTVLLLSRQDTLGWAAQARARERRGSTRRRDHGAMVHQGFRERSPAAITRMTRDVPGHRRRRLYRLRRSDPRHGPPAATGEDHRADAGHRRPARSGDHARSQRFIRAHIPGARIAVLEAAHIANVEQPQAYADTVLGFLRW